MEKPILFNTEMVKAIMEDRKTQTRRVIKNKYTNANIEVDGNRLLYKQNDAPEPIINADGSRRVHLTAYEEIKRPYEVGDILWVRETWCNLELLDDNENFIEGTEKYYYRADEWPECNRYLKPNGSYSDNIPWRPSIHMPRDAARIFLKVKNIRAERLQDITEESALKEGIDHHTLPYKSWETPQEIYGNEHDDTAVNAFKSLWNNLYKNWDENPWVWVIEFEKCQ